jgi:hypothetical protein
MLVACPWLVIILVLYHGQASVLVSECLDSLLSPVPLLSPPGDRYAANSLRLGLLKTGCLTVRPEHVAYGLRPLNLSIGLSCLDEYVRKVRRRLKECTTQAGQEPWSVALEPRILERSLICGSPRLGQLSIVVLIGLHEALFALGAIVRPDLVSSMLTPMHLVRQEYARRVLTPTQSMPYFLPSLEFLADVNRWLQLFEDGSPHFWQDTDDKVFCQRRYGYFMSAEKLASLMPLRRKCQTLRRRIMSEQATELNVFIKQLHQMVPLSDFAFVLSVLSDRKFGAFPSTAALAEDEAGLTKSWAGHVLATALQVRLLAMARMEIGPMMPDVDQFLSRLSYFPPWLVQQAVGARFSESRGHRLVSFIMIEKQIAMHYKPKLPPPMALDGQGTRGEMIVLVVRQCSFDLPPYLQNLSPRVALHTAHQKVLLLKEITNAAPIDRLMVCGLFLSKSQGPDLVLKHLQSWALSVITIQGFDLSIANSTHFPGPDAAALHPLVLQKHFLQTLLVIRKLDQVMPQSMRGELLLALLEDLKSHFMWFLEHSPVRCSCPPEFLCNLQSAFGLLTRLQK